jgi:HSP20 family protein
MSLDQLSVEVENNLLTVSGEKTSPNETGSEITYGRFIRYVKLPSDTVASEASADLENGVLSINIPRSRSSPSKIEINVIA